MALAKPTPAKLTRQPGQLPVQFSFRLVTRGQNARMKTGRESLSLNLVCGIR